MKVTLPVGTVSLLFSDIEGSTALLSRLGDAYQDALDGQRGILRRAWSDHGGVEMGTEGDSFFVVFSTAPGAVSAAAQAQRWLAEFDWPSSERVRVRMGIHTGSPTVHDGGYVGMDVHRAARISAAAHGGQILLSAATADLIADALPTGVSVRDLGVHRLKDIPRPDRLHQLVIEGIVSDFPPPRTIGTASSLPKPATSLFGRDGELRELTALLSSAEVGLVTLTGPGGSGKTRLAVAVATRLAALFADGVYFVDGSASESTEALWSRLAIAIDAPAEAATPAQIVQHLGRNTLVVLDNLEQLADADIAVAELLNRAPSIKVLATSRRALLLPEEHVHPVPPLGLPEGMTMDEVRRSGAVQLFVRRAQMVRPEFALTELNAAEVAEICRRLDGLPLALGLAAARMRLLSPKTLVARLHAALDIAASGRTGPERHNTLREAIAWSYRLLDADQKALFRRLCVFAGGADLDAVEAVCGSEAVDGLVPLVDASLVVVTETDDGDTRINMLVTLRAYALQMAETEGELQDLSNRHLIHLLDRAVYWGEQLLGPNDLNAIRWFQAELDNLRAALQWVLGLDEADQIYDAQGTRADLALSAALRHFWHISGASVEGRSWLEQATGRPGVEDGHNLARCLLALSQLQMMTGDTARALETSRRAEGIAGRLNDDALLSGALASLARDAPGDQSLQLAVRAVEAARRSGDQRALVYALSIGVLSAEAAGNFRDALAMAEESSSLADELNDPYMALKSRHNAAFVLYAAGDCAAAAQRMVSLIPQYLGVAGWDLATAADDLALCLGDLGSHSEAALLIGAADAENARQQIVRYPSQEKLVAAAIHRGRKALPGTWEANYHAGSETSLSEALLHARASLAKVIDEPTTDVDELTP